MDRRLNISFLLQWQLLMRRWNFWHLSALLLCLAAAIIQWLVLPAIEQHVTTLNDQLRNITPQDSVTTGATLTEERFQAFRDRLVDDNERTEILQKVFAEAEKANIALQQGDYVLLIEPEGNFSKLQISLPLKGSYSQIRIYAQTLLEMIPALSLDEIGFRRASVSIPNVEAKLHLTLYIKGQDNP
jgi:hypothetical protein